MNGINSTNCQKIETARNQNAILQLVISFYFIMKPTLIPNIKLAVIDFPLPL